MNCIVTAGPTYESLDRVRRLTNFSTGKLGSDLADSLADKGHNVVLLKGYYAVHQAEHRAQTVLQFTTTADLKARLQGLANSNVDAVFHAAAVSDFGFGRVFRRTASGGLEELQSGKFSTRDGVLLAELVPTEKIIAELRHWFSAAWLVGWKYEVDDGRVEAIAAGAQQIRVCRTDACVVNGPAYGAGFGFVTADSNCTHLEDSPHLFELLSARLQSR